MLRHVRSWDKQYAGVPVPILAAHRVHWYTGVHHVHVPAQSRHQRVFMLMQGVWRRVCWTINVLRAAETTGGMTDASAQGLGPPTQVTARMLMHIAIASTMKVVYVASTPPPHVQLRQISRPHHPDLPKG